MLEVHYIKLYGEKKINGNKSRNELLKEVIEWLSQLFIW